MQTMVEHGCGLDVHQATVGLFTGGAEQRTVKKQIQTFNTTTRELVKLREWFSQSCTHVAMESTGVYWKPVFAIL
jgi:hypothetical protein